MRRLLPLLVFAAAGLGCSSTPTGANPLGCQPACTGSDLCCPWSGRVCPIDAGCYAKSGYRCVDVDPDSPCPALQFDGTGDGG
jgi:hypothetical protein